MQGAAMSGDGGELYVVATPIGNLGDLGRRAAEVLGSADLVAAEDTRQTAVLLREYGIATPMRPYHEHNEQAETPRLVELLAQGRRIALVSDAGTPLVSDPGFRLVSAARERGIRVTPIPGPSALVCALSACGLPSDRFLFAGFPPRTGERRRALFRGLAAEPGTLIFYESGHRIRDTLDDLCTELGGRRAVLARELTKLHETFLAGSPCALAQRLAMDPVQTRGEHVVLVAGADETATADDAEAERVLRVLLEELPLKQAAGLAARITGRKKNALYKLGLGLGPSHPGLRSPSA
jgi:16S rRNA (cytidine1402-2'-O)-methyltransferase